jgi:hypothetical protein
VTRNLRCLTERSCNASKLCLQRTSDEVRFTVRNTRLGIAFVWIPGRLAKGKSLIFISPSLVSDACNLLTPQTNADFPESSNFVSRARGAPPGTGLHSLFVARDAFMSASNLRKLSFLRGLHGGVLRSSANVGLRMCSSSLTSYVQCGIHA